MTTPETKFPCLDHGYLQLVTSWGSDEGIIEAARMSTAKGFKGWGEPSCRVNPFMSNVCVKGTKSCQTKHVGDEKLLRYLWENKHCYAGDMEVLTARGWVKWSECNTQETFLVPDTRTRTLRKETLDVEIYAVEDEEMVTFANDRMSFEVTLDHRMWFSSKHKNKYEVILAGDMPKWGHFDPLKGYKLEADETADARYALLGFTLGDGSFSGQHNIVFHLKKLRKIEYLKDLFSSINLDYRERQSSTYKDAVVITVTLSSTLREFFDHHTSWGARSKDKDLYGIDTLTVGQASSLLDGLVNSDGAVKHDRPQINFASTSLSLIQAFETLSAMVGVDAHRIKGNTLRATAYSGQRTSLEARKQYFGRRYFTGHVYCTTTSTGFLMVRGAADKFAFVCGNSTPFEMAGLTIEVQAPIFVFRQWHRHRTQSYSEMSARYTQLPDEDYIPSVDRLLVNSTKNKQAGTVRGASNLTPEEAEKFRADLAESYARAEQLYQWALKSGVPKELARVHLPVARYSRMRASANLRNWLGFLTLRLDPHAQYEIRVYAEALGQCIAQAFPRTWELFAEGLA